LDYRRHFSCGSVQTKRVQAPKTVAAEPHVGFPRRDALRAWYPPMAVAGREFPNRTAVRFRRLNFPL